MLAHSFREEIFPYIQPENPRSQLEVISLCPITSCLGEETDPHLLSGCFREQ